MGRESCRPGKPPPSLQAFRSLIKRPQVESGKFCATRTHRPPQTHAHRVDDVIRCKLDIAGRFRHLLSPPRTHERSLKAKYASDCDACQASQQRSSQLQTIKTDEATDVFRSYYSDPYRIQ